MSTKSDFMAAEEIKAILQGRDKAEQEKIIRWVCESLGLTHPAAAVAAPVSVIPPSPMVTPTVQPPGPGQQKDIKSFFAEKKPKNDLQSAAVMAYFCRFEAAQTERKEALSAKDLQEASRQARGYVFK